jgi:hypothetical protein
MAFLIRLTSSQEPKNRKVCFTASDLTDRLLPGALRAAYTQKRALSVDDLVEQAKIVEATPKFGGN